MLTLLPFLVATVVGPAPPPPVSLTPYDLATLTDAEARQLAGRRALYVVWIDSEPDGRLLALPASKREVILWDLRRGGEWRRLRGFTADLTGLAFAPNGCRLVTGLSDSTSLIWDVARTRQVGTPDLPGPEGVARACADLAADARKAFAAPRRLADSPGQAMRLLKEGLRPAKPAGADEVRRLIANLDDEGFAVREDASKRLEELGESAEGPLRRALADRPSPEACRRIGRLLEALRGPVTRPEALRSLRALAVLEDIGTSEARQALDRVAQGAPDARLTREAKASLERLDRRTAASP